MSDIEQKTDADRFCEDAPFAKMVTMQDGTTAILVGYRVYELKGNAEETFKAAVCITTALRRSGRENSGPGVVGFASGKIGA